MKDARFSRRLYEEYKKTLNCFNGMNGVEFDEGKNYFFISTVKGYERETYGGALSPKTEQVAITVDIKKEEACYWGSTLKLQLNDIGGLSMRHVKTLFERVYNDIMEAADNVGAKLVDEHTQSIFADDEELSIMVWTSVTSNDIHAALELQICWSHMNDEEEAI